MTDPTPQPSSDYLAKDYQSFRQLMLDHLAALSPASAAAGPASIEMTLVEALAYLADNLSYYQDAVATEAYLGTARQRVSVARHARLLDYRLSEGCSARVWVHFESAADDVPVACGTVLATGISGIAEARLSPDFDPSLGEVFETMHAALLTRAHNRMTLAAGRKGPGPGSTSARLAGVLPRLAQGDVLIFQHAPSGQAYPVRLLSAAPEEGVTAIAWHDDDALPDVLPAGGDWTVLGNIVLADHGWSQSQALPPLPPGGASELMVACAHLAYAVPYRHEEGVRRSAAAAMRLDAREAQPSIRLIERAKFLPSRAAEARAPWIGCRDILGAGPFERIFAVEPADGGRVTLRFGRHPRGRRLQPEWDYEARYRRGGGSRGNIGAGTIAHVLTAENRIQAVANPLPATGGSNAEPMDEARLRAPFVSRVQRRCVTDADYVAMTNLFPGVLASTARRSWEHGASTVAIGVVRDGSRSLDERFTTRLADYLAAFKMIGDALVIDPIDLDTGAERKG